MHVHESFLIVLAFALVLVRLQRGSARETRPPLQTRALRRLAGTRAARRGHRLPGGNRPRPEGLWCLELAVAAYLAAGGGQYGAERAVRDMIASLSREHGEWLWGPAQAWRDQHASGQEQPEVMASLE